MLLGHPVADLAVILKKLPTGTVYKSCTFICILEWLIVCSLLWVIYLH